MLAEAIVRLQRRRPIRYAMDPAHEQAIRNYLQLATRSSNSPRLANDPAGQAEMSERLGPHLPTFNSMLNGVFSGDPSALPMLLDMHEDITENRVPRNTRSTAYPRLMQNLDRTHREMPLDPAEMTRGYGTEAMLGNRHVQDIMGDVLRPEMPGFGILGLVNSVVNSLAERGGYGGEPSALVLDARRMHALKNPRDPRSAIGLYDILENILSAHQANQHLNPTQRSISESAQMGLSNALYHILDAIQYHNRTPIVERSQRHPPR